MSVLYVRNANGTFVQIPSIPGKSAYEIAVEKRVFEGTEQEFAEMQVFTNKDILDQITQENIDFWNSAKGMTDEEKEQLENLNKDISIKFDDVQLNEQETTESQTALDFYANGKLVKTIYFTGSGSSTNNIEQDTELVDMLNEITNE